VRGGADLAAINAVRAAIEKHGVDSTLIVVTDMDRTDAIDWLPKGAHIRVLSAFNPGLSNEDRELIVEMLVRSLMPRAILNVNSSACWNVLSKKGGALSKATNIYAFLFCRDFNSDGHAAGYADTHLRDALPHMTKVYFDNRAFLGEMVKDLGVPPSLEAKLQPIRLPMGRPSDSIHSGGPVARNYVIWAGRFCAQKNIDLLIAIAGQAPDFEFHVFGYGEKAYADKLAVAAAAHSNLKLMGPFTSTAALPLDNYNAFLYTSLWDGLPLTLVDVAAEGIPVVASAVGGIPEFVNHETGWLISAYDQPGPYVDALREIRERTELAAERGRKMRSYVVDNHSWSQFVSALSSFPSFID
jgi:glycosyltransferase involved in cell wall biosynthesis